MGILQMDTLIVSTWRNRWTLPILQRASPFRPARHSPKGRGSIVARAEAPDRGRDLGARCVCGTRGAGTRSERQPSVRLAASLSARAAKSREPCPAWVAGGSRVGGGSGLESGTDVASDHWHDSRGASEGAVAADGVCGYGDPASGAERAPSMIGLPAGTRIWIVAGVTDMRRGLWD